MQSSSIVEYQDDEMNAQKWVRLLDDNQKGISKIGRVCCLKINQKWTMKRQIGFAFMILFLAVFTILVTITSYNIVKVSAIMQNSQNQLYITQAQKKLKIVSNKFKRIILTHFQAVQADALNFQKIFLMESSQKEKIHQNFTNTAFLQNQTQFQNGFYYSWICNSQFSNETGKNNAENLIFNNTVLRFNQIQPLIVNQNYTYLTSNQFTGFWTQEQLIYVYPCLSLPSIFKPQNRTWYIDMIELQRQNKLRKQTFIGFQMSQPYFNYVNHVTQVSLSKSLFDKNYNFKGVTGSAMDISRFTNLFQISTSLFTSLLVNFDGSLVISPYFNDTQNGLSLGYFFQNLTITGFDHDDWQQVTNSALKKDITHNCSLHYLGQESNFLCRWNKMNYRNELIFSSYLKRYNYYIVILLDEQQFLQELYVKRQQIEDNMIQINLIYFSSFVGLFILLLGLAIATITTIFKPLTNITAYCNQINDNYNPNINEKKPSKNINIENILVLGVFRPFTLSFLNLVYKFTGLRMQRSPICGYIEQIKYPKMNVSYLVYDDPEMIQILGVFLIIIQDMNIEIDNPTVRRVIPQMNHTDNYRFKQISTTPKEVNQICNQRILDKKYQKYIITFQPELKKQIKPDQEQLIKFIFEFYKKY